MAYDKTIWNETTAITPERLNKQENGIAQVANDVDIAMTQFQTDVDNAIAQSEQNVINGKTLISNAANTKRVITTPNMTFQELANKISEINLNRRILTGTTQSVRSGADIYIQVQNLPFRPSIVLIAYSNRIIGHYKNEWFWVVTTTLGELSQSGSASSVNNVSVDSFTQLIVRDNANYYGGNPSVSWMIIE